MARAWTFDREQSEFDVADSDTLEELETAGVFLQDARYEETFPGDLDDLKGYLA
jgi:hypothetical protein